MSSRPKFFRYHGLTLVFSKCVIIPLFSYSLNEFSNEIVELAPDWKEMKIKDNGMYLGILIGIKIGK